MIEQLRRDGLTVLLVEQNATQSLAIADRGYVLTRGKVSAAGTTRELTDMLAQGFLGNAS